MTPASGLVSVSVAEAMSFISPAPWKVVKLKKNIVIENKSGCFVAEHADDVYNARLIASAPELLKAAVEFLARIDHITTEDFRCGGEKAEREALRAAIAKALGLEVEVV